MPRCDPYVMKIDCNSNCYSCKGFGYLARNCKNRGIMERERRLKYRLIRATQVI